VAKKQSKKTVTPATPAAPPGSINPFGPTEQRQIIRSKVVESIFTLSDGTQLLIKPIVGDIRRAVGQYNQQGDPVYFLAIGQTITTKSPKALRKNAPRVTKKAAKRPKKRSSGGKR
jgi:hypothetical protein